jgi:hypothetical protein
LLPPPVEKVPMGLKEFEPPLPMVLDENPRPIDA